MKFKNVLVGTGLLIAGYATGHLVGQVRMVKVLLDEADKDFPGFKQRFKKDMCTKALDRIFDR